MNATVVKVLLRAVGTLAGLLGAFIICVGPFFLPGEIRKYSAIVLLYAIWPAALAVYLIWVAYLIWFKLSPVAVQHGCGIMGFLLIVPLVDIFERVSDPHGPVAVITFFGAFVALCAACRVVTKLWIELLFPGTRVPR